MTKRNLVSMMAVLMIATFTLVSALWAQSPAKNSAAQTQTPSIQTAKGVTPKTQSLPTMTPLATAVDHKLALNPWYGVFDWVDGQVTPGGQVVLRGQVVNPVAKSDAAAMVKEMKGVSGVKNEIEVLPVSPNDDRIRIAVYHSIFRYDSPLFLYANRSVPPIHILVKNGNVTLKGYVGNKMDSQLAYTAAMEVPGVFGVSNELKIG